MRNLSVCCSTVSAEPFGGNHDHNDKGPTDGADPVSDATHRHGKPRGLTVCETYWRALEFNICFAGGGCRNVQLPL